MYRKEKGFTLIELLVVIAILGILAAVVIPNVSKFMGRGSTEAAATELQNVQLAVTAMLADHDPVVTDLDSEGDITSYTSGTPGTKDMGATGMINTGSTTWNVGTYLQNSTTSQYYYVNSAGKVFQISS